MPISWYKSRALRLALTGLLSILAGLLLLPWPAAPAQAASNEVFRVPPGRGMVALTFDGGENPGRVTEILATLKQHKAKATFFLCGIYIDSFPSRARAIVADGHEMANHSYHNVNHQNLSNQAIVDEIRGQEAALLRVTGVRNAPYWRAPYGYRNDRVVEQAARLGYRSVMWSLDSRDTIAPVKSASYIFQRLTNQPRRELDGGILLLHVNPNGTVDALPRVLDYLDSVGLRQVTVGELLGDK